MDQTQPAPQPDAASTPATPVLPVPPVASTFAAPAGEVGSLELLRLFRQCSHAQRRANGSHGQNRILRKLAQCGPMTQRDLAASIDRTPATLCQQLEAMGQAGLVERAKCADDRRNVSVRLTPAGERAAEEAEQRNRALADALFGDLGTRDRAELFRILSGRLERWRGVDPEAFGQAGPCGSASAGAAPGREAENPR